MSKLDNSAKRPNIIARSKNWDSQLLERLSEITGQDFYEVTEKDSLNIDFVRKIDPKYIFFPHWSYHISSDIYEEFNCVIFHMTDLPFGRGGSPLQNLIIRGIESTKVTALKCVEEMDAGPIYLKKELSLLGTAEEIYIRASKIVESMILEILSKAPEPKPQIGEVTLFTRRKPEDGNLEVAKNLDQIFNMIRMMDAKGYPLAYLDNDTFRLEFSRASFKGDYIDADVKIRIKKER